MSPQTRAKYEKALAQLHKINLEQVSEIAEKNMKTTISAATLLAAISSQFQAQFGLTGPDCARLFIATSLLYLANKDDVKEFQVDLSKLEGLQ